MGARKSVKRPGGGPGEPAGAIARTRIAFSKRPLCLVVLLLGLITLIYFGDVLFGPGDRILSREKADIWNQFAGWRWFGFEEIRAGNFPLWTPLVCAGTPFFSGLQSALLYPPNWLHLALPLPRAINWVIAIHFWWLGCGMFFFMRSLGARPAAGILASLAAMFGAPYLLHIGAGHLTNLAVMAWAPWLLWVVERWREEQESLRWVAAGAAVVAVEILAGHAQYVYYGAIATGLYALLTMPGGTAKKLRFPAGIAGMFLWGAVLAAVQFLPAIEAAGEALRGAGGAKAKYFAGTYSFPPENLVTLLAPGFFGGTGESAYWGRWSPWEMTAFCGVTVFWCVLAGIAGGGKRARALMIAAAICVLFALGSYTPFFHVLYAAMPGWGWFRGNSKFIFYAGLFAISTAGLGFHHLLEEKKTPKLLGLLGGGALLAALSGALWVSLSSTGEGGWAALRQWLWDSGKVFEVSRETFFSEEFADQSRRETTRNLWVAAGILGLLTVLVRLRRYRPAAVWGILPLAVLELGFYAGQHRPVFSFEDLRPDRQMELRRRVAGDYRVYDSTLVNSGMLSGLPDLWGEDPVMLGRYARFMGVTQKRPPDQVNQNLELSQPHPLWALLRARYALVPGQDGRPTALELKFEDPVMQRFAFFTSYEVHSERDLLLGRLFSPDFDPWRTLLLEEAVELVSTGEDARGEWRILRENSDEILVDVSIEKDCLMLMTDAFSKGWRVKAADGSKENYTLLPANYCLRAIPLRAGTHRLRIYYRPRTLSAGIILSGLACIGLLGSAWRSKRGAGGATGAAAAATGLLFFFSGCAADNPRREAREVLKSAQEAMSSGNFTEALQYYSPSFIEVTTSEKWLAILETIRRNYGLLERYEILETMHRMGQGAAGGMDVVFIVRARYEKDSIREEIIISKAFEEDQFRIKGHSIKPELLTGG